MNIFNQHDEPLLIKEYKTVDEFEFETETVKTDTIFLKKTRAKTKGILACFIALALIPYAYNLFQEKTVQQFNNYGTIVISQQDSNDSVIKPPAKKPEKDRSPQKNLPKAKKKRKCRK